MLTLSPVFGTSVTRIKVAIHKVKVVAILDSSSPVNAISYLLAHKIKMASVLDYLVVYRTKGLSSKRSIETYLAFHLRVEKLVLTAPAVVLKKQG